MSVAFRFLIEAREKLYNSGILGTFRLNHPVISVGNLTVGGTGKTPLVIALAEALRERGFRPVVLSRGYGRTTRGIVVVEENLEDSGDEPLLMKRRLKDVPVVVGPDRYRSGLLAEQKNLGNIFILDDGFQHRRIYRDVDIVTIDPVEWAAGELLLPAGRWREPRSAVARAHIGCVQRVAGTAAPDLPIPSFDVETQVDGLYKGDEAIPVETTRGRVITAFAGIAKPEKFFNALESIGIHAAKTVRFRDHHHYSSRDVARLGGELLITTEKDAVRLSAIGITDFLYLRISVKIPDFGRMMQIITGRLTMPLSLGGDDK